MNQNEFDANAVLAKKGFAPSHFRKALLDDHNSASAQAAAQDDQYHIPGLSHNHTGMTANQSHYSKRSGPRRYELDPAVT